MIRLALCAAALVLAGPAAAREVAGVKVPEAVSVEATELRLNGAGLRRATMFHVKVYVGALYLAAPSRDADAVVRADEPKAVHMRFLREVGRGKIMDAFREGFEKNSPADAKALQPGLDRVAAVLPAELKEGTELVVTYVPGKGTTVASASGEVTIAGKPFADAMFRNWLGPHPADDDLKKAMLGQ
jgi:Chalcone isomerase-like